MQWTPKGTGEQWNVDQSTLEIYKVCFPLQMDKFNLTLKAALRMAKWV